MHACINDYDGYFFVLADLIKTCLTLCDPFFIGAYKTPYRVIIIKLKEAFDYVSLTSCNRLVTLLFFLEFGIIRKITNVENNSGKGRALWSSNVLEQ